MKDSSGVCYCSLALVLLTVGWLEEYNFNQLAKIVHCVLLALQTCEVGRHVHIAVRVVDIRSICRTWHMITNFILISNTWRYHHITIIIMVGRPTLKFLQHMMWLNLKRPSYTLSVQIGGSFLALLNRIMTSNLIPPYFKHLLICETHLNLEECETIQSCIQVVPF